MTQSGVLSSKAGRRQGAQRGYGLTDFTGKYLEYIYEKKQNPPDDSHNGDSQSITL
jgi:hypothetical protein